MARSFPRRRNTHPPPTGDCCTHPGLATRLRCQAAPCWTPCRAAPPLLTTLADVVDADLLEAAGPGLRIVANHAVGFHNIDVSACEARGVIITNTPDVLTDATADLAWALLLAAARRVGEGERWIRSEKPGVWAPTFLLGRELRATTLGIVGLGRIGRAVARRGLGFGMTIAYHNRQPLPPAMLGGLPAHTATCPRC